MGVDSPSLVMWGNIPSKHALRMALKIIMRVIHHLAIELWLPLEYVIWLQTWKFNPHIDFQIESIDKTTYFGKPRMEEYWFFLPNCKFIHICNQTPYHPAKFHFEAMREK